MLLLRSRYGEQTFWEVTSQLPGRQQVCAQTSGDFPADPFLFT